MCTYGVHITTQISDHIYDIEVKGQGQIYLKFVLQLVHFVTRTPQALSFLMKDILRQLVLISYSILVDIYYLRLLWELHSSNNDILWKYT